MPGPLDPRLLSDESERMERVLRLLEEFVPPPGEAAVKLPRLGAGGAAEQAGDAEGPAQHEGVTTCPSH